MTQIIVLLHSLLLTTALSLTSTKITTTRCRPYPLISSQMNGHIGATRLFLQPSPNDLKSSKQKKSMMQLIFDVARGKESNGEEIKSVQDFDLELANEIEEALLSAGVDADTKDFEGIGGDKESTFPTVASVGSDAASSPTPKNEGAASRMNGKRIVRPPVAKADSSRKRKEPELPPHSSLAQVIAQQYNIDLRFVEPSSNTPNAKITASDVEYYAYKISQPPCTPEALQLAYSLGLDLNDLYDSDSEDNSNSVLELADVKLYQENMRSLQLCSQSKRDSKMVDTSKASAKRKKKLDALDKRMEKNMERLSQNAQKVVGTVAEGIVQRVNQRRVNNFDATSSMDTLIDTEKNGEDRDEKETANVKGISSNERDEIPGNLFFVNLKDS